MPAALLDMANRNSDAISTQYPGACRRPAVYPRLSTVPLFGRACDSTTWSCRKKVRRDLRACFAEPPVSSQQIMHPDLYFANTRPLDVPLPKLPDERDWKMLTSGSLGEFDHAILLEQYLSKERADAIAPHWRGGSRGGARAQSRISGLCCCTRPNGIRPENARKMFDAYRRCCKGNGSRCGS